MTPKERFITALKREKIVGRVPHFELTFFLTMEAFGKVYSLHRQYSQWDQMSDKERWLHREDIADLHIAVAEKYGHDAIFLHTCPFNTDEHCKVSKIIKEKTGDKFFICVHGDPTFAIPDGDSMLGFSFRLVDEPEKVKEEAQRNVDYFLKEAEYYKEHGAIDGFALCADYCLNTGPFLSPNQFREFVFPYLKDIIAKYREMGFYTIKHTDGNIMPIIDMLVEAAPDALHSLDPQAGVDIAKVKELYGDKICLIGNVNCGLMQTGTEEQVIESARYALKNGMPNYGYIFSTSNCVYTGMDLKRYELILDVMNKEGIYQ